MAALTPLRADWKITTAVTYDGHRSVQTEYFKNGLRRYDSELSDGKRYVSVVDNERLRKTIWDVDRREYVVTSLRRMPQTENTAGLDDTSRPILLIEISTTDTGERQTIFGREAQHFLISEKRYRQANAGAERVLESESNTDSWYVDIAGLPREKRASAVYYLGAVGRLPLIKVNRTGPAPNGLAVRERTTSRYFTPSGESSLSEKTTLVTSLSDGSLADEVFEPPADFQRVTSVPNDYQRSFSDEIQIYWNRFLDYLSGLFL